MFISMPGAVLVNGQFETAKEILADFSRFQNKDSVSQTWGRIPNRANTEGILYNTTDGTPRFVMQIEDYIKYSGDTAFTADFSGCSFEYRCCYRNIRMKRGIYCMRMRYVDGCEAERYSRIAAGKPGERYTIVVVSAVDGRKIYGRVYARPG